MTLTRTTGALAVATALTLAGLVMPATANAQTGITIGEPGSAAYQAPTATKDEPIQLCGTAYVGDYDSELTPAPLPDDAKAIIGLTVTAHKSTGEVVDSVITNEHGGYCFREMGVAQDEQAYFSIDQTAIDAYNASPGAGELTKTAQVLDQAFVAEHGDDPSIIYAYMDLTSFNLHNANIAFSQEEPPVVPPEPMGSTESFSLQFFNLPEILRGMLHGGTGGSLGS